MRRLSPEEYIIASISLYLDVINLFLETLRILSKMNKQWTEERHKFSWDQLKTLFVYNLLLILLVISK